MSNPCDVIESAISGMVSKMDSVNGKTAGLRRLAVLMERASDPRTMIPDIDRLVPIATLDVQGYENLRSSCPFLNLPPATDGLDKLRSDLNRAYNDLISRLKAHPFLRLQRLVNELDRLLATSGIDLACINSLLQCARTACITAGQNAESLEENARIVEEYEKNAANTTEAVLSESAQTKVREINDVVQQIENLQSS